MSIAMLAALMALGGSVDQTQASKDPPKVTCNFDEQNMDAGYREFDTDKPGGWRALEKQNGCQDAAADVLHRYRDRYQQLGHLLAWHEGQVRASSGEYKEAILLMEQSRSPATDDLAGWNPYVDATVAFLRHDKVQFVRSRRRLMSLPKPAGWPTKATWPQNAAVLDGLDKCFDEPYKIAYGESCRK